jgi:hypothetical protein
MEEREKKRFFVIHIYKEEEKYLSRINLPS